MVVFWATFGMSERRIFGILAMGMKLPATVILLGALTGSTIGYNAVAAQNSGLRTDTGSSISYIDSKVRYEYADLPQSKAASSLDLNPLPSKPLPTQYTEIPQTLQDGFYIQYAFNSYSAEASKNFDKLKPIFNNILQVPFDNGKVSGTRTLMGRFDSIDQALEETDKISGVDEVGIIEVKDNNIKWRLRERLLDGKQDDNIQRLLGMPKNINEIFLEELNGYNAEVTAHNSANKKKKHGVDETLLRCILYFENSSYDPGKVHYRLFPVTLRSGKVKFVNITDKDGNPMYPVAYGLGGMTKAAMKDAKVKLENENDIFDVRLNLRGAIRYNGRLMDRFNGNRELVVASYNGGPTRVDRLGRVPDIPETKRYVAKIDGVYQKLTASGQIAS